MENRPVVVDETGRVLPEEYHARREVAIYEQPVNKKGFHGIMHRHMEVQFSLVTKGSVVFRTEKEAVVLKEGQAIFFNSNVMHQAEPERAFGESVYICMKFSPSIVLGQFDPYIKSNFVDTILHSRRIQMIPFVGGENDQRVARSLTKLTAVYGKRNFGYELNIRVLLMQLWQLLFEVVSPMVNDFCASSYSDQQRGEILQDYICKNYAEKITLEDISRAAHISRGECCRIFKRLHHTTPFQYLIHFRLTQSLQLLCESDASISQIAQQVGFGSSSYYTECFKKEMKCTPLKYRQNYQSGSKSVQYVI